MAIDSGWHTGRRRIIIGIVPILLAATSASGSAAGPESPVSAADRAPVLLELFSSEGCSSCPAAEQVLAEIDAAGAVNGVPVLALELHVDYWDYLGWRDPFASAEFTARQEHYGRWLAARSYTPQLVIDGQTAVLGSNRERAAAGIAAAAPHPTAATVQLERQGKGLAVRVVPSDPAESADATVLLAITERGLQTRVARGENRGQTLRHGPVVRTLERIGMLKKGGYSASVPLALSPSWNPRSLRAVVFVQSAASGRVLGAAALPL
jgi:hypothetical protein